MTKLHGAAASTSARTQRVERRAQTRRALIEAASRLLEQQPWPQITVDDFTTAAGLSRTVFYHHFLDRQDLLLTLIAELNERIGHIGEQWLNGGTDPITEHRQGLREVVQNFVDNGRLIQALKDAAVSEDTARTAYTQMVTGLSEITATAIRRDIANGHSNIDNPDQIAHALVCMNENYLLALFGRHPLPEPEIAINVLIDIWTHTLYRPNAEP